MGVFEDKALYFCRGGGGWLFSIQLGVENVILQVVVLLKMQFCGYPLFKWDLVGCLDLNTNKNEKKTLPIL